LRWSDDKSMQGKNSRDAVGQEEDYLSVTGTRGNQGGRESSEREAQGKKQKFGDAGNEKS